MEIINIISSLLIPIIAILTVYIAYQQYLNGKDKLKLEFQFVKLELYKLKLELYNKRYLIFKDTKEILKQINLNSITAELDKFIIKSNESKFLFKDDIKDYFAELVKNALDLKHLTEDLDIDANKFNNNRTIKTFEHSEKVNKKANLIDWFTKEYGCIEDRFLIYLDFKNLY